MIGEVSLYGIYFPPLMLLVLPALLATRGVSWALARIGFYRWIWHPALFDVALFVIMLSALSYFSATWF